MTEINEQVSQVSNYVTAASNAQESAASAEELNGQAASLRDIIRNYSPFAIKRRGYKSVEKVLFSGFQRAKPFGGVWGRTPHTSPLFRGFFYTCHTLAPKERQIASNPPRYPEATALNFHSPFFR